MGRERSAAAGLAVRAASLPLLALLAAPALAGEPAPEDGAPIHHTCLRRFGVGYDVPEDTARVRLWITEDGGAEWRPFGYDTDTESPVGFATDRDGTYGFVVAPEDRAGNRTDPSPGAPPQLVMIVDTAPPKVELLAPNDGFVGPGRGAVIRWRASDEYVKEDSARLEYSTDRGASWIELADGLSRVGSFTWTMEDVKPPDARSFRFRVTARDMAGNSASAVSTADVLLDDELPTARATGPEGPAGGDVEVAYEADDAGGAGVESVRLYASADGGDTWELVATDNDARPPLLWRAARTGSYGLFAAAVDRAGNASPAPEEGAEAHVMVEVRRSLEVRLGTLHTGGYYKGGAPQPVAWEVKDPAPAGCTVRLEYSINGGDSWEEIASGLGPSGEFRWTVPKVDAERALVRATARAPSGEAGSDVSRRPFVIDSTPPRAVVAFDASAQDVPVPLATEEPPPVVLPGGPVAAEGFGPDAGSGEAGPRPPKTPREIVRARGHVDARRYDEAVEELKPFLEEKPADAEANLLLGVALARATDRFGSAGRPRPEELLRRYGEAEAALRTALVAEPESNDARVWIGACLLGKAEVYHVRLRRRAAAAKAAADAAAALTKALSMDPNAPDEYLYAGLAHYILASDGPKRSRAGEADRAATLFRRALEGAAPSTAGRAHFYLAGLAEGRGDGKAALGHWKKVVEILGAKSPLAAAARRRMAEGR
ncbi:MAG: hypothetical protein ACYTKD_08395 [Planctomycetota bacterium]|jgi:cytochrome c-type biogenesis protein CcmH/NrfG